MSWTRINAVTTYQPPHRDNVTSILISSLLREVITARSLTPYSYRHSLSNMSDGYTTQLR